MRTLKLQIQLTLDGYMATKDGQMDWVSHDWSDDLNQYVGALTKSVDCILLGRTLAEGFIPYWAANPTQPGAEVFNHTPKVVFSRTLTESPWPHTTLATGLLTDEIMALKQATGGDIITYGGSSFAAALIQHQLVDEFFLFVNPTAIGQGTSPFQSLTAYQSLTLVDTRKFDCGIVLMHYTLPRP
ncbi:MAG: dihydrofolate reductase family protein [Roseiflexaceae bacterium]|jgi:dihydrofolate reductase